MRKLISVLLLVTTVLVFWHSDTAHAAIYTGGLGSGWSYAQAAPAMYRGGSGKGDSSGSMSSDTTVGYAAANKVVFTTQPNNSVKNAILATSPVVQVQDAFSNLVPNATNTITLAILNNPGGATLGGTTSKAASSGSATFSDLTINQYGTAYTLSASATGLTSATSNAFNVSYGAASQLSFATAPSSGAYAGVAFTTQPIVNILDAYNNIVANATNTVSLSIANDPPTGSTLGGTTSMAAVAGVADFSGKGLNISRAGTGFTLSAAATGLTSATSSAFNILSPIQVTSPNGGEVWTISTAYNITWSTYGSLATGTNTVQYSLNNGSTWTTLSTNGTSPLSWVTPSTATTQALVRVSNSADSTFTSTSNAVFSLLAGFTMIAPNGGEVWANGFAHTISWSTTGTVANVKLEYSSDGGSTYSTIVTSTANNNQYSWTPSVTSGGANYKVRVSDASNSNSKASSASAFTIQKVAISAPTSGQRIQAGTSASINWSSQSITNVKIEYSTNSGTTWNTIIASTSASGGTYSWSVPSNFTTSTNVTVRVSSTAVDSDNDTASATSSVFTIYGSLTLTAPNGSEQWAANTGHNITWTTGSGTITNVKLEYSADNFVSDLHTIIASTPNTGTYSWTPTTTGSTFKVRVSDAQDSLTYSISANYFSVTGIGITAPASGATWNCGSSQTITWNYTGSFNYVKIEYSTDSGSTWNTIIASTPNTGTYSWTVANTPSNAAQIRVSNASDPATTGTSQTFNIKSVLAITAPNGGETLNVGSSSNITWTTTGTVSNVKLEYSSNNGSTWNTIIASTTNTGTYSWTVVDAISSSCLVKLTDIDSGHPASTGQSAATFTIQSNMAITAPASAVNWAVGETHNITWTNTGTVGQIRLYYATSKDSYAAWTEITSGATTNSNTYSWTVSDIILAVGNDPQTTPTLAVKVKVVDASSGHPATTVISSAFNVIYYTITFSIKDSQTLSNLAGLSVSCSSGWSASNLTSGVNAYHNYHYGTYTTIWSKSSYTDVSSTNWIADSTKTISLTMTLSSVAGQEYHVYSNFTYDSTSDSFKINAWLEHSGAIVTSPTSCTVSMYDKNDAAVGNNLTSSSPNANGVFRMNWNLTNINRNTTYFGKVQIVNSGATYSSNVTYSIAVPALSALSQAPTQLSTIQTSVGSNLGTNVSAIQTSVGTGLNTAVSAVQTSVGSNLGTNVSAIQTSVGSNLNTTLLATQTNVSSILSAVGADVGGQYKGQTIYDKIKSIADDTNSKLPATIRDELKKMRDYRIVGLPSVSQQGDTVPIKFKSKSGLSPVVTVYDADNITRVSDAKMLEIGSTGVYEYDLNLNLDWGKGQYMVVCSEGKENIADSAILNVTGQENIASIAGKIDGFSRNLDDLMSKAKNAGTKAKIEEMAGSIEETSKALAKAALQAGIKQGQPAKEAKKGLATLEDLRSQLDELKKLTETVKLMLQEKQEPVVKTWFEPAEKKTEKK